MPIKDTELILNADGSIYHLNLKPQHIANTVILVGDQDRVSLVSKHFDTIDFKTQKREFKTHTGTYNQKKITVISTGIGTDNIDIVLNELDALININFKTRTINSTLKQLNIIRVGTSGAIQSNISLDSFLISTHSIDMGGFLQAYHTKHISNSAIESAFVKHTKWPNNKAYPLITKGSKTLISKFKSSKTLTGCTFTANGFYGSQHRILRLPISDLDLSSKVKSFDYKGIKITNLEMETAAIYGLSKLLGHNAVSLNAIIANRSTGAFSKNPNKTIEDLIHYTLQQL